MRTILPKIWRGALTVTCLLAGCALPAPNRPAAPPQAVLLPTVTPEAGQAPAATSPLTADQTALLALLKNHGPAPELFNETWLNSAPLTVAELRGKVVMIEFWTFG